MSPKEIDDDVWIVCDFLEMTQLMACKVVIHCSLQQKARSSVC